MTPRELRSDRGSQPGGGAQQAMMGEPAGHRLAGRRYREPGTAVAGQLGQRTRQRLSAGRSETRLAGTLARTRWLAAHAVVVGAGSVLIVVVSSVILAVSTAWSVGNAEEFGPVLNAGRDYLPAELVFAGLALALFGLWPRGFGLAWAAYAGATFIAFLGPGPKLSQWILDLAPTTHVGNPPLRTTDAGGLAALAVVAAALALAGFIAFHRRDVPDDSRIPATIEGTHIRAERG
jgi:ABC-2 type transport system permease protein